jgi:Raf kinase inhibitor-like YbhB/YbcL family protein
MAFRVWSNDMKEGGNLAMAQVFNGFGHSGGNTSPHLAWDGAPEGTKSFVVTCYDPDAPTGSGWWHWVVINIPASTKELATGAGSADGAKLPKGAQQMRTDYSQMAFGGAAPPAGPAHHYIFTVFALKVEKLELDPQSSAALVGFMTNFNSLGKATLTALYGV